MMWETTDEGAKEGRFKRANAFAVGVGRVMTRDGEGKRSMLLSLLRLDGLPDSYEVAIAVDDEETARHMLKTIEKAINDVWPQGRN